MPREKFNSALAEIESFRGGLKALGGEFFDLFRTTITPQSNVPPEFYEAVTNVSSQVEREGPRGRREEGRVVRETVRRLLGIECPKYTEALLLLTIGDAISLAKRSSDTNLGEDERSETKQQAEEMLGAVLRVGRVIEKDHRRFLHSSGETDDDHIKRLFRQMEQRTQDPKVRAKIVLLAHSRGI